MDAAHQLLAEFMGKPRYAMTAEVVRTEQTGRYCKIMHSGPVKVIQLPGKCHAYQVRLTGRRDGEKAYVVVKLDHFLNDPTYLHSAVKSAVRDLERFLDRLPLRQATADAQKILDEMS